MDNLDTAIKAYAETKESVKSIVNRTGVHRTALYEEIEKRSLAKRNERLPPDAPAIIADYNSDMPVRDLRKKHQVSMHYIYDILAKANVPLRSERNS